MQFERWQKIEFLFGEALVLPPAERSEFLSKKCGGDFELHDEIVSMLDEDLDAEFLSEPIFNVGAQLLEAEELPDDSQFGFYQLQKLLGRGGMGAVYLALDTKLERLVALKILPVSALENQTDVMRFRQEARMASGVSHPNVAHIYEFGEFKGRWFLAMEYVAGKTLRELFKEKLPDETEVLQIVKQISHALAATHQRGIVHWDVKPENIMVADDGAVKVLDFGLAKPDTRQFLADEIKDTLLPVNSAKIIIGTVAYMSPEQILGEQVDSRSDLWSLGVILFEMLAGERPFVGETAGEVRLAILNQNAPIDKCPKRFRSLIGKLLEKNAVERVQTAEDLLAEIQLLDKFSDAEILSPDNSAKSKKNKILLGGLVVLLFFLIGAGFPVFYDHANVNLESAAVNSIAVLPFINEKGDAEDYLADGLTESLINKLSRLPKLSVKTRGSVVKYKGQTIVPQTVGRELSVEAILLGRVNEQDENTIVTLDLINTVTGSRMWSKQFRCANAELISLQSEVMQVVSNNLQSRLSDADEKKIGQNYTENAEAYRLYLKGRFHWNKRTAKDLQKSIEYYEQAIALDSQFALAFAGLADTYLLLPGFAVIPMHEAFPKAEASARKALELDNSLAEARNALAYVFLNYQWNAAAAEREINLAIELDPNYATAHQWYGNSILLATGRFDEAIFEAKRAQELEPLSLIINADLGTAYLFSRRVDEAIEQFKKTIEMDENFAYAHVNLGRAYLMKNDFPAAIAECQKAQSLSDDPRVQMIFARIYAKIGKKKKALQFLDGLKKISRQKYVSAYYFALVYAGLGDNDSAFDWLEKAFQDREGRMTYLKVDPLMDELRTDRRFEDLIRRVGLETKSLDGQTQLK